jgi:[ribosomal protein S18]-alanine N-acetyltransferase
MTLNDLPDVHVIDMQSFSLPWSERSFRFEVTSNPASRCWVVEIQEGQDAPKVVGLIVIWLILDEAHIGTIAIHPDYRRHGLARKLLVRSLIEAHAEGAQTAMLEVRRGNLGAQALYTQLGFEVVGVRPRYYKDNYEDALLLTLSPLDADQLRRHDGVT